MQTLVQVLCTTNRSLRDAIVNDTRMVKFNLVVSEKHRKGRPHGWAKLHSYDPYSTHGAINIQWEANSRMLLCRVITRGSGKQHLIIGDFIDYLLARFPKKIEAINILPR